MSRSNIAIEGTPAVAAVHPLSQRLASDRPTLRARLACASRVDQLQRATGAFCLVADVLDELVPRGVVHGLGQHPAGHPFDVQVLHRNVRKSINDRSGQLVREVPPLTGGLGAMPGQSDLNLPPASAATLASGQSALQPALPLGRKPRVLWCGDRLTVRQRDQRGKAKVDADRREEARISTHVRQLDLETDIPLAARTADDGGAYLGVLRQFAMPAHFDFARDTDDAEALALSDCQAVADAEVRTIEHALGAEPGEPRLSAALDPTKERTERLIEATKNLLFGAEAKSAQAFVGFSDRLQFSGLVAVAQADAAPLIGFDALLQTGVIKIAECAKQPVQSRFLGCAGADAVFVRPKHLPPLLRFDVAADRCFRNRANRCDEVRAGPQRRQPGPQRWKFGTQHARRDRLELRGDLRRRPARVGLDKGVDVVRHHFQRVDRHVACGGDLAHQFLQPGFHPIDQDGATIFRTPDDVILEAENCPGIPRISGFHSDHAALYNCGVHNIQPQSKKGRAFRCQLPQTVPCAQS